MNYYNDPLFRFLQNGDTGGANCRGEEQEQDSPVNCLSGKSLAMVYSPCQVFEGLYAPEEALAHGTMFYELEKPFWGARRLK